MSLNCKISVIILIWSVKFKVNFIEIIRSTIIDYFLRKKKL